MRHAIIMKGTILRRTETFYWGERAMKVSKNNEGIQNIIVWHGELIVVYPHKRLSYYQVNEEVRKKSERYKYVRVD